MKKVLLQNHPGSEKYSFNGWEIFNSNFERMIKENKAGNDSNLLIVFYVQIMPDDFVMQLHRF